jgi:hypothetical protein
MENALPPQSPDRDRSIARSPGPRWRRPAARAALVLAAAASLATSVREYSLEDSTRRPFTLTPEQRVVTLTLTAEASRAALGTEEPTTFQALLELRALADRPDRDPAAGRIRVILSPGLPVSRSVGGGPHDPLGAGGVDETVGVPTRFGTVYALEQKPAFPGCSAGGPCRIQLVVRLELEGTAPVDGTLSGEAWIPWGTREPPGDAKVDVAITE